MYSIDRYEVDRYTRSGQYNIVISHSEILGLNRARCAKQKLTVKPLRSSFLIPSDSRIEIFFNIHFILSKTEIGLSSLPMSVTTLFSL